MEKARVTLIEIFLVGAIVVLLLGILLPSYKKGYSSPQMVCGYNLSKLGKAMLIYANGNDSKYPIVEKWCDLLIEYSDLSKKLFKCPGNKKQRCSYAMNSNCEPNSPNDVVLLFETKGGWNQFGWAELLTTENHKGKGCNILFNDGHAKFVKTSELGNLNWGDEQKQ